MGFWRNPEVYRSLLVHLGISILAGAAGCFRALSYGAYVFGICLFMTALHLLVTYRRYRKIALLAVEIDKMLHNEDCSLQANSEGELAILQTEIQKMTIRLREHEQQLTEEKQYLSDSLADISHQLRTPLTSMHLLVTLLSEPELSAENRSKHLHELHSLLSRIDWLVTTLLKISRLDAGTVQLRQETISLSELLQTACTPLQIPAELKEQILSVSAEGCFYGDQAWTAEAVGNIVKNCMEHTPPGGEICIRAQENPLFSEIIITDNGSGIAPEDLPHIFERFYKGKDDDSPGFGIGLALARTIIMSQNGTIKAENLPEKGAKFTIRFYKGTV